MTTNDNEFAKKLTSYLDDGAAGLKPGVAYRLQLARQEALGRLADPRRSAALHAAHAFVGQGTGTAGGRRSLWTNGKLWLGILLIAAAAFGFQQWEAYQQLIELEETDAALLSSDLPIDAYLDRGFQNWLNHTGDD